MQKIKPKQFQNLIDYDIQDNTILAATKTFDRNFIVFKILLTNFDLIEKDETIQVVQIPQEPISIQFIKGSLNKFTVLCEGFSIYFYYIKDKIENFGNLIFNKDEIIFDGFWISSKLYACLYLHKCCKVFEMNIQNEVVSKKLIKTINIESNNKYKLVSYDEELIIRYSEICIKIKKLIEKEYKVIELQDFLTIFENEKLQKNTIKKQTKKVSVEIDSLIDKSLRDNYFPLKLIQKNKHVLWEEHLLILSIESSLIFFNLKLKHRFSFQIQSEILFLQFVKKIKDGFRMLISCSECVLFLDIVLQEQKIEIIPTREIYELEGLWTKIYFRDYKLVLRTDLEQLFIVDLKSKIKDKKILEDLQLNLNN